MYGGESKEDAEVESGGLKRLLAIIIISAIVIWVGAGCQMARIKSLDLDMGGLELEYWEPAEAPTGVFGVYTNRLQAVPVGYPRLMPMHNELDR